MRRRIRQTPRSRPAHGPTGRRGSVIAASAAALCLGTGLLTGCGSGPGDGYVAVGAAAGDPGSSSGGDGRPSGKVTLTPLDGSGSGSGGNGGRGGSGTSPSSPSSPPPGASGSGRAPDGAGGAARTQTPGGQAGGAHDGADANPAQPSASTQPSAPARPPEPSKPGSGSGSPPAGGPGNPAPGGGTPGTPNTPKPPAPPATPAALKLSAPQRAAADKRWCEKVTVEFRNTGGTPARSGTVTFATHIIGALGVDWATITSSQPLPAPIGAGSARSETYTVCVESWRVPLGMRVETQGVSAVWK